MIKGQPTVTGEATRRRRRMRLIVWPIIIGVMGIGIYALWRDLAAGHYLKVLLIGPFAAFVGVRAYWQAKQAARS